jgi:hypothetical protein
VLVIVVALILVREPAACCSPVRGVLTLGYALVWKLRGPPAIRPRPRGPCLAASLHAIVPAMPRQALPLTLLLLRSLLLGLLLRLAR